MLRSVTARHGVNPAAFALPSKAYGRTKSIIAAVRAAFCKKKRETEGVCLFGVNFGSSCFAPSLQSIEGEEFLAKN